MTGPIGAGAPTAALTLPKSVPLPKAPAGYDLLAHLGGGGMGDVFLAREQDAKRLVAMKFLRATWNSTDLKRFQIEVQTLAAMNHPNIVGVLGTDFMGVDPFFTMELARGGSLWQWVEKLGPLDPADAARLTATVARAIAAVHRRGILHRDLKPSNILLALPRGSELVAANGSEPTAAVMPPGTLPLAAFVPQIGDMGLAKQLDAAVQLTPQSGMLGTLCYAPPEQLSWRNGELGPASDVYGLGTTLFHLLTGRPPFGPGSQADVMQQVLTDPVPRVRAVRPDVPLALEAIVVKCLEKDPQDRYQTADELADDLDRFLTGRKPAAPPLTLWRRVRRWIGRNRKKLAASGLAVLLAAGLVALAVAIVAPWRAADSLLTADDVRRKLQTGDSVTLVGPDEVRVQAEWGLGPCELTSTPSGDTRCSFRTRETAILILVANPGITRFRVRADLRQDMKLRDADKASVDFGKVGLAIGHSRTPLEGDVGIHALWLIGFCEYPTPLPDPPPDRRVTLYDMVLWERPLLSMQNFQRHGPNVRLRAPPHEDARPWRTIVVDVTPTGVVIHHDGQAATDPTANLDRRRGVLEKGVQDGWARGTPVVLPRWGASTTVGIFASSSWVSARNVTIEPLP